MVRGMVEFCALEGFFLMVFLALGGMPRLGIVGCDLSWSFGRVLGGFVIDGGWRRYSEWMVGFEKQVSKYASKQEQVSQEASKQEVTKQGNKEQFSVRKYNEKTDVHARWGC